MAEGGWSEPDLTDENDSLLEESSPLNVSPFTASGIPQRLLDVSSNLEEPFGSRLMRMRRRLFAKAEAPVVQRILNGSNRSIAESPTIYLDPPGICSTCPYVHYGNDAPDPCVAPDSNLSTALTESSNSSQQGTGTGRGSSRSRRSLRRGNVSKRLSPAVSPTSGVLRPPRSHSVDAPTPAAAEQDGFHSPRATAPKYLSPPRRRFSTARSTGKVSGRGLLVPKALRWSTDQEEREPPSIPEPVLGYIASSTPLNSQSGQNTTENLAGAVSSLSISMSSSRQPDEQPPNVDAPMAQPAAQYDSSSQPKLVPPTQSSSERNNPIVSEGVPGVSRVQTPHAGLGSAPHASQRPRGWTENDRNPYGRLGELGERNFLAYESLYDLAREQNEVIQYLTDNKLELERKTAALETELQMHEDHCKRRLTHMLELARTMTLSNIDQVFRKYEGVN